jgi:GH35 family endo-1,4-beta-xylanase
MGQEFSKADARHQCAEAANDWNVQLRATNTSESKPVIQFAPLLGAQCKCRKSDKTGSARFTLQKQKGGDASGGGGFSLGPQWQRYSLPIVARHSYPAQGAELNFQLGQQAQTLEFGGLSVHNLGQGVSMQALAPLLRPAGEDYLDRVRADLKARGFTNFMSLVGEHEDQVLQTYSFDGGTRLVPVTGQPFKKAHVLDVKQKGANEWSIQLRGTNATPIKKGDVIFITFTARTLSSADEAKIGGGGFALSGLSGKDFSDRAGVTIPPEWQTFNFSMVAGHDYPANGTELNLKVGGMAQMLEVGGIGVFNMGQGIDRDKLPKTVVDYNYAGREANAAWRKAAQERIEKHRKGDLRVLVTDTAGKPIPGAQVQIAMKRHAFVFGVAEHARDLVAANPTEDQKKLQANVQKYFNTVTFANDLKMPPWTGEGWGKSQRHLFNREQTLNAIKWLHERGMGVRGHTLVWPSWGHTIPALKELENDPPALRKAVENHIRDIMTATKGQLIAWDVINEPYMNNDLMRVLGPGVMAEWFVLAKQIDPKPTLYINEAGAEQLGAAPRMDFLDKIKFLKEKGAPVEGIGLQSHFNINGINPPENLLKVLDQFAQFGLPIASTELDVDVPDPRDPEQQAVQADYLRDVLTVFFSHPQVTQIVQWGFFEKDALEKERRTLRQRLELAPVGKAYEDLVLKDWWTSASGKSNTRGEYSTRAFLGDYEITITAGGKTKTVKAQLPTGGQTLTVKLN